MSREGLIFLSASTSGACLGSTSLLRALFKIALIKKLLSMPVGRNGLAELLLSYFRTSSPCHDVNCLLKMSKWVKVCAEESHLLDPAFHPPVYIPTETDGNHGFCYDF